MSVVLEYSVKPNLGCWISSLNIIFKNRWLLIRIFVLILIFSPLKSFHHVSGSCIFWQTKPWLLNWQWMLVWTEHSRTTYFWLGLFVLVLIRMVNSRQLWTYNVTYWMTCPELRGLNLVLNHDPRLHRPSAGQTMFTSSLTYFVPLLQALHDC